MRIGILSASPRAYSTKRLKQAAKERGHKAKVLDYLRFSMHVEADRPGLYIAEKRVPKYDAVIPRIGASATVFGTAVVRQFEQMGVYTLNSAHCISVARDKLRTVQVLSRHKIAIPASACLFDKNNIPSAVHELGGTPVVIKLLQGTQGVGVMLAESEKSAEAIIETLHVTQQNVLIQKFVSESRGRDIRAFVVGDRVVASMRRIAQGDEFRSNVHRGGLTEPVKLDAAYENAAIRATRVIGLNVAGVDILEGKDGPLVMEVNASPGLEGIEAATQVDVAGEIIEFIENQVLFPHFDIGERLALGAGYGLFELPVTRSSLAAKKTLDELNLIEKDIQVLCVVRKGRVFPNPDGELKVLPGDILLCYGEKIGVRDFIPSKLKRLLKPDKDQA